MKVKILVGTVADGKDLPKGKVVELPEKTAKFLIAIGRAQEVKSKK